MIQVGRDQLGHLEMALGYEWLATNGLGGYASSTLAMANTRRYHGLLVAALLDKNQPSLERTVLVSKLNVFARLGEDIFPLTSNEYTDGTIDPHGYLYLQSFRLQGAIPVFVWAVADALIEQRVWMAHGQNTTYVTYTLERASSPIALAVVPLCTYRNFHHEARAEGWSLDLRSVPKGVRVTAFPGATPYWLRADRGIFVSGLDRHWGFRHRAETYRGMDDSEDLFAVGRLDARLVEGETLTLVLSTERNVELDWQAALAAEQTRQADLIAQVDLDQDLDGFPLEQLVLAADQFVVKRPTTQDPQNKTIIAGYHWPGEWVRDTMISLPGLTLATKRYQVAAKILRTWAQLLNQGMLPDRFPGDGSDVTWRSADATLWYVFALDRYFQQTGDFEIIQELYPLLVDNIECLIQSAHHNLRMDESDGLLYTGEPGVPMTWMNAKVGEWIVTPRIGKVVEVNALWCNTLQAMAVFAERLQQTEHVDRWTEMAERVVESFERFWYPQGGYLYDLVDGPEGDDNSLRPNQIFAVSLPYAPLVNTEKAKAIVDIVGRRLLVSYGLRTLNTRHPDYVGRYGGNLANRDRAYHQGIAWSWLIGPYVQAHLKVHDDIAKARSFLRPFAEQLNMHGMGSVSEIFDGDPPHTPRGCIADAWGVAGVLCAWFACTC